MHTMRFEETYKKLALELDEIIPERWDKVYLYARVSEGVQSVYFYYYPQEKNQPIYSMDIIDLFEIDEDIMNKYIFNLCNYCKELWQGFKENEQELWTNFTFFLNSDGKFNFEYDYTDLSKVDDYERQIIWEYKYLGIEPSIERKRDRKILDSYLKKLNKK